MSKFTDPAAHHPPEEPEDSPEVEELLDEVASDVDVAGADAVVEGAVVEDEDFLDDDTFDSEATDQFPGEYDDEDDQDDPDAEADEGADDASLDPDHPDNQLVEAHPDGTTRKIISRLGSGVASTGKFIWNVPSNLGMTRSDTPQLRKEPVFTPLGARQVSHGYADDLWQARPPLHRPYPVILIHGTISSKNVWQNLVLRLRADDFVVFCPDYGMHGTQDIPTSAADVGAYIEQVLAATGATQVDIVGHSQGGLLARYWINELGGEDYVHHLITLGSPHHGTSLQGMMGGLLTRETTHRMAMATIRRVFGPAGMQQVMGSPVLETLAASEDTRPDVMYSCFATLNDSTVVPHDHAFLKGEGARTDGSERVRNAYLQDEGILRCRHEELPSNLQVQALVHDALVDGVDNGIDWGDDED